MKIKILVLSGIIVFGLLSFVGNAKAATEISSCQTISAPGQYVLTSDISSNDTCISITADNVELDGAGHKITYAQTSVGYGITVSAPNNVTIKNTKIVQGSTLSNNSFGIYLYSNANSTITGNTITTNGAYSHGIYLLYSTNSTITGNVIIISGQNPYVSGIRLDSSDSNTFYNNTITISGENYGIGLSLSDLNTFSGNTIKTTGISSFGIAESSSSSNTFSGNTIATSGSDGRGIYLYSSSNSIISDNTITTWGTSSHGVYLHVNSNSNTISGNTITTSGTGHGIYLDNSNSDNIHDNIITIVRGYGTLGVYEINSASNTISNNTVRQAQPISSCSTISIPDIYILTADISSDGTCITIGADNVELDGAGHTITYAQTIVGKGVYAVSRNNVTIKNLNIVQGSTLSSSYGIHLWTSSNFIISNNKITTSGADSAGIRTERGSNSNTISNNVINSYSYGVMNINYNEVSSNSTISNNTITTSGSGHGILLQTNASSNTVSGNTITASAGMGIYVLYDSDSNTFSNNSINSASHGIYLHTNIDSSTLINNTITTSGSSAYGIYTYSSSNNTFQGNSVTTNSTGSHGFALSTNSNSNTIFENIITTSNTSAYGIYLGSGSNNNIASNTISTSGNYGYGILLASSGSNTLSDNTITTIGSAYGIYLQSSSNSNNISANTITTTGSTAHGILLQFNADSNAISNNIVTTSSTGAHGIALSTNSNSNTIFENIITTSNTSAYGIYLGSGSNNNIASNTISTSGNYGYGILLASSGSNTLSDNTITTIGSAYGIYLQSSSNSNNISANTITTTGSTAHGILLQFNADSNAISNNIVTTSGSSAHGIQMDTNSNTNTVSGNKVKTNTSDSYVVVISGSSSNTLYNNHLTASRSDSGVIIGPTYPNSWNTTLQPGTNIVGGNNIGGNFWTNIWGTGFSDTCADADANGICDSSYTLGVNNVDYYPLSYDWDPPVTTATYIGTAGDNDWYTSDVSATLTATDERSGVKATYICVDQNNTCVPAIGATATISMEGTNYARYYSIDNVGNVEQMHSDIIMIDKTVPSVSIDSLPQFDGDGAFVVSWSGSDVISDALVYEVYRNGQLYATTANTSISETGLSDAVTYSYYVIAKDWAGLSATSGTTSTTIDLYPPTVPDLTPLAQFTKVLSVFLDWTESTDVVSGVNHYDLYKNSAWLVQTLAGTTQHTDTVVTEGGVYSYAVSATDNVEHESNQSDSTATTIDTQPPATTHTISGVLGDNGWYKQSAVGITLSATDAVSGVAHIYYKINDGGYTDYTGSFSLSDGQWTVMYYSIDIAGNMESAKSFDVKVDITAPITQATVTGTTESTPYQDWHKDSATVTLSANDNLSGVSQSSYCLDQTDACIPSLTYSSPIAIAAQGINYLRFNSTDLAGNQKEIEQVIVKIDKDTDGDGIYDNFDKCINAKGLAIYDGCPVADKNIVELHIVNLGGSPSTKQPLAGAEIRVFDRNNPDFQVVAGSKNPDGSLYGVIYEADAGKVGFCTTDNQGTCLAGEAKTGDYLVIVKYFDPETAKTVYVGKPKSPSDFKDTNSDGMADLVIKDFQIMKVFKKGVFQEYRGGSKIVVTGSMLEVIAPESSVWEGEQSIYPFVFTSDSDWTVDVCAEVPQGYSLVGIYNENGDLITETNNCLQVFVANETKAMAFELKEIASPEPSTNFNIKTTHKGKTSKHPIKVNDLRGKTFNDKLKNLPKQAELQEAKKSVQCANCNLSLKQDKDYSRKVALTSGQPLWLLAKDVLIAEATPAEIAIVTKVIAKDNDIIIPEWNLNEGKIDARRLPAGFLVNLAALLEFLKK